MSEFQQGQVVKLDRGYPLVRFEDGSLVRCEHATDLVKEGATRAVIGDYVHVSWPDTHDKAVIAAILPRRTAFVRKDPAERTLAQTLAANFDFVIIAQPLPELNMRRLERELVLAHETGAQVVVVLTKGDMTSDDEAAQATIDDVQARVGAGVQVFATSLEDEQSVEAIRALVSPNKTAVLIGKSGAGKSSLVNMLVGSQVQETGAVRESDRRGRHTTVSRELVDLPGGGSVVDMPGIRGLGMWEAEEGIGAAFPDVDQFAQQCKFVDCKHVNEPGCAVLAAFQRGDITQQRLDSYRKLMQETQDVRERKERARWQKQSRGRRKGR